MILNIFHTVADKILLAHSSDHSMSQWLPIICWNISRSYIYIIIRICLSVCFFVPYARPQFSAYLHEIWHVASLYPTDGHGGGG